MKKKLKSKRVMGVQTTRDEVQTVVEKDAVDWEALKAI